MLAHSRYKDAEIIGVDLSLSSLAYALRKLRESGVDDIALMQGDILSLESWSEPMDVVECVGVLHHMEDPIAGWRILTGILKPGGVMKIGLYSALAREEIVKVRDFIAQSGYEHTEEDIRRGRQDIVELLRDGPGRHLLQSSDFHSLNGTRDLLFHVHEHQFTLPQIADTIEALGLDFIGFELANWQTSVAFKNRFPEPDAMRTLDAWHRFELDNPHAFAGMYQFWLTKPATT
jgi:SAM-dependent methyltransferase